MHGAEAVREARMLCSLIGVEAKAKLFNAAQSLKFGRVDQLDYQPIFRRLVAQLDDVVNRIAIDTLRQFCFDLPVDWAAVYHTADRSSAQLVPALCSNDQDWALIALTDFRSKNEFSDLG